nr:TIGR03943 family protein [Leucobacter weissii]
MLLGTIAILWLAGADRLGWYIHPRYFTFTVTMMLLAAVATVAALALTPSSRGDTHDHDHVTRPARTRWRATGSIALVALTGASLLIAPPATLSTVTAENRELNVASASERLPAPDGSTPDYELTVRDWSLLLRQSEQSELTGRSATLLGFVAADRSDPDSIFTITRFVVNCCAVDAQPVGVPVYRPGWQQELAEGDWVSVSGTFAPNPSALSEWPYTLLPSGMETTTTPEDPYVY